MPDVIMSTHIVSTMSDKKYKQIQRNR